MNFFLDLKGQHRIENPDYSTELRLERPSSWPAQIPGMRKGADVLASSILSGLAIRELSNGCRLL
jgi:hypothetical protein